MKAEELIEKLNDYGADTVGALERFMDDAELYEDCINIFLEDQNLELLRTSLAEGDSEQAFFAAHALKGVASNLGLTPLLKVICEIVEPLRTGGGCDSLTVGYAEVAERLAELREVMQSGE